MDLGRLKYKKQVLIFDLGVTLTSCDLDMGSGGVRVGARRLKCKKQVTTFDLKVTLR